MKILWFTNTYANAASYLRMGPVGGGWLQALDAALQQHVDLSIVFNYPKPMEEFRFGETNYYPVTPSNWRFRLMADNLINQVFDRELLGRYLTLIEKIKPDLIHIHGTENSFGSIIGETDIPVVVSIQGNLTVYTHKYFSGLSQKHLKIRQHADLKRIDSVFKSRLFYRHYKKLRSMAPAEQRNMQNCKYIIGRTDWDKRVASVLAPKATYFHGDEMLREEFYYKTWSHREKSDEILIHSTTTNGFYKGFETICECLCILNKLGQNIKWQVAGLKESDLIVKAVKRKMGSGFPVKGLYLLGSQGPGCLSEYMLKADMYVMTSHIENSPNSLCEAMLLGMPCIATYAGGTGSLIEDKKEGLLVQDGDPWVLAGAILEYIKDPGRSLLMAEAAHGRAVKRHNKDRILNELMATYREITDLERFHGN